MGELRADLKYKLIEETSNYEDLGKSYNLWLVQTHLPVLRKGKAKYSRSNNTLSG
jgi:hypothetical protein